MNHKKRFLLLLLIILLAAALCLSAQENHLQTSKSRGDYLTLKVAVFGPGSALYHWWGHIGLIVEDTLSGKDRFYDWGLFSFDNENFFFNFAFGRLLYSCGVSPAEPNILRYILDNRDVTIMTLDLPAAEKERVWRFAENNVLPENRDYYYHHFRDNCATRIRDILDTATGGQFKSQVGDKPGRFTYRQHVRRHTWFSPFFDWFLMFCMGQSIDAPITVWDEMFLPSEIEKNLLDFRYTDPQGELRSLVSSRETFHRSQGRPAVLETPRRQWPRELALGLSLALVLGLVIRLRNRKPKAGRITLGISQSVLGLFFGFAGSLLFFMAFFTNHDYTYQNSNLLMINPLLLAAVPLGILLAAGKGGKGNARRLTPEFLLKVLWTACFLGGVLSILLKVFQQFPQQNWVSLALFLPPAFVLSFLPGWIRRFTKYRIEKSDMEKTFRV